MSVFQILTSVLWGKTTAMLMLAALTPRDHTNAIVLLDIFEMGSLAKVKYFKYNINRVNVQTMINIVKTIRQEQKQRCKLFDIGMPFPVRYESSTKFQETILENHALYCDTPDLFAHFISQQWKRCGNLTK